MARIELPQRGLHLEYESHGDESRPAVFLIMGLGMQLLAWPPTLIDALVAGGYRVITFDNRDVGLSGGGAVRAHTPMNRAMLASLWRLPYTPPYRLADMADDTLALADALRIERFHVVGASLGGMIAHELAELAPERVLSLTSIMSSAGPRTAPWPHLRVLWRFLRRPTASTSFETRVEHFVTLFKAIGNIRDPVEIDTLRKRMARTLKRAYNPEGVSRQLLAVMADRDRSAAVSRIRCPTLILHGADDPLIPLRAAYHLKRILPKARLEVVPGMGHYLPASVVPLLSTKILELLRDRADA
ncbi:MAG: alpha/beta hydrolase [Lysobacterales bacterium]